MENLSRLTFHRIHGCLVDLLGNLPSKPAIHEANYTFYGSYRVYWWLLNVEGFLGLGCCRYFAIGFRLYTCFYNSKPEKHAPFVGFPFNHFSIAHVNWYYILSYIYIYIYTHPQNGQGYQLLWWWLFFSQMYRFTKNCRHVGYRMKRQGFHGWTPQLTSDLHWLIPHGIPCKLDINLATLTGPIGFKDGFDVPGYTDG